ncbi:MAG: DNA-directed RNA polymerase sigma subunit (sigma70/sigma32), partial [Halocynthiibacter sp.]
KERVRQLEVAALDKMRRALESNGPALRALIE